MRRCIWVTMMALAFVYLFPQAGPFSGNANVTLQFDPAGPVLGGGALDVEVYVDLSGITGAGAAAAALGGFALPIAFDNNRLTLTAVVPGGSAAFAPGDFVFTNLDRANARGFVTVINTQVASGTPTGVIHVATLTFNVEVAGKLIFGANSARTLHEGSLASTYTATGGPEEIGYLDQTVNLTVGNGGVGYHLIYPLFLSKDTDFMGVTVVNEGATATDITFTGYGADGALIQQPGITNPADIPAPLPGMQQYVRFTQALFGGDASPALNIEHGWIGIEAAEHNVSGFFLVGHFNESWAMTQLDGADVSHTSASRIVFPVLGKDATRNTEVFVVNPGATPATGTFRTMNADGTEASSTPLNIPAHGVFEGSIASNAVAGDGYFDVQMTSGEVVGLEKFGNANALAILAAQNAVTPANVLYDAHFASGNYGIYYFTEFCVINPGAAAADVTFHLINDDGAEVTAPVVRTINSGNLLRIMGHTLFGLKDPLTTVWGEGTSGSVIIESDQGLVGSITFGDAQNGMYLASLPLLSTSSAKRELFLDHVAIGNIGVDYFTGICLVNPSKTRTATINIQLYDQTGNLVASSPAPVQLGPGKRSSQMLGSFLGGFAGPQFGGFVKITADVEVFSFMLFGDMSLNFMSAVPVR